MKKNSLLWGIGAAVLLSSVAFAQSPAANATAGDSVTLPDPIKLQLAGIVSTMMRAQLQYSQFKEAVFQAYSCQITPTEKDPYNCVKPPVTPPAPAPAPPPLATPPPAKPAPPPASPPPVASPATPPSPPAVRK